MCIIRQRLLLLPSEYSYNMVNHSCTFQTLHTELQLEKQSFHTLIPDQMIYPILLLICSEVQSDFHVQLLQYQYPNLFHWCTVICCHSQFFHHQFYSNCNTFVILFFHYRFHFFSALHVLISFLWMYLSLHYIKWKVRKNFPRKSKNNYKFFEYDM